MVDDDTDGWCHVTIDLKTMGWQDLFRLLVFRVISAHLTVSLTYFQRDLVSFALPSYFSFQHEFCLCILLLLFLKKFSIAVVSSTEPPTFLYILLMCHTLLLLLLIFPFIVLCLLVLAPVSYFCPKASANRLYRFVHYALARSNYPD